MYINSGSYSIQNNTIVQKKLSDEYSITDWLGRGGLIMVSWESRVHIVSGREKLKRMREKESSERMHFR